MSDFLGALSNGASLNLGDTRHYAAILGLAPSQGARSPILWNRAFKSLGFPALMHPMDVTSENLPAAVNGLRGDPNFIGGAVAVPYKQKIVPLLDQLEEEAQVIGAVNCVYRRDGSLVGANTDGAASLLSIQRLIPESDLRGRRALLMGVGGAGRAVATFVAKAIGPNGMLFLANRSSGIAAFAERLKAFCQVNALKTWPVDDAVIRDAELIVNCTSIGSELIHIEGGEARCFVGYTPLAPLDGIESVMPGNDFYLRFADANKESIIRNIEKSWRKLNQNTKAALYDIVYQPRQTVLVTLAGTRGWQCLGGELMNLEQAVIAFAKAVESVTREPLDARRVQSAMTAS
jgi:shikimate dehydrogenase